LRFSTGQHFVVRCFVADVQDLLVVQQRDGAVRAKDAIGRVVDLTVDERAQGDFSAAAQMIMKQALASTPAYSTPLNVWRKPLNTVGHTKRAFF
jgi:hypothetical protein